MSFARISRAAVLVGLSLTALAGIAQSAQAQDRVRLTARLSGIKARCSYEERVRDGRYKFNLQLELAQPGTAGTVTANTAGGLVTIGSFVVDSFGRGIIDIDTNEGDAVPNLDAGNVVTLQYKNNTYSGTLTPR